MRALLPILPLLAIGCSPAETGQTPQVDGPSTRTVVASASASSSETTAQQKGGAKAVTRSDEVLEYSFSYPAAVGAIPELARLIESQAQKAEAEQRALALAHSKQAEEDGFAFRPYGLSQEWEVVADLPSWLSLSNEVWIYTGGAHGMYGTEALVWNKQARRALEAMNLFTSPAALMAALRPRYCAALDEARRARGREMGIGEGLFDNCPDIDELTVLLGSSNGRTFDRLTLYAGPYVAGSYAEGAYETDLTVDAAVLAAVKPRYRSAFSVR